VITGLAALQAREVGLLEVLDIQCNAGMQFGNRWFGCHHSHGATAFETALMVSCDVYFYQIGLRLGLDRLSTFARSAGLGRSTGFELKEASGLVPDREWYDRRFGPRGWTRGNILNLAIGQGEVLATPLQLATLMASIAREWRPVVPYIVQRVGDEDRRPVPPPQSVVVDPLLHRALVRAMHSVVEGARGTGQRARVHGITVAGKTGTAQNPHGEDHAVFAGFAPVETPRIAFAVIVEHGGHGGAAAAPVAARVIEACFGEGGALWAEAGAEAAVPGGD
jgi:penicillin-binding protein 2